jgi:hypothetical protein
MDQCRKQKALSRKGNSPKMYPASVVQRTCCCKTESRHDPSKRVRSRGSKHYTTLSRNHHYINHISPPSPKLWFTSSVFLVPSLASVVCRVVAPPSRLAVADHLENSYPSEGRLDDRGTPDATKGEAGIGVNFRLGIRGKTASLSSSSYYLLHRVLAPAPHRCTSDEIQEPFVLATSTWAVPSGLGGVLRWNAPVYLPDATNGSPQEYRIPSPPQRTIHTGTPCGRVSRPVSRSQWTQICPPSWNLICRLERNSVAIHRSKTFGRSVAIVRARVLGCDGCPERSDEEIGMGPRLQKCRYGERAAAIEYCVFGETYRRDE